MFTEQTYLYQWNESVVVVHTRPLWLGESAWELNELVNVHTVSIIWVNVCFYKICRDWVNLSQDLHSMTEWMNQCSLNIFSDWMNQSVFTRYIHTEWINQSIDVHSRDLQWLNESIGIHTRIILTEWNNECSHNIYSDWMNQSVITQDLKEWLKELIGVHTQFIVNEWSNKCSHNI